MQKTIKCTDGERAFVDPEHFDRVSKFKWRCAIVGGRVQRSINKGGKVISMSLAEMIIGKKPGLEIDHINRNPLDNRKKNLRHVTSSQNKLNRRKLNTKKTTSRFKGVSWCKNMKKWRVRGSPSIRKRIDLGYFDCEFLAAGAYNKFMKRHHSNYALLNDLKTEDTWRNQKRNHQSPRKSKGLAFRLGHENLRRTNVDS